MKNKMEMIKQETKRMKKKIKGNEGERDQVSRIF